jgi:hypothetical protein
MTTSFEPKPERTEVSTQVLPTIPTVEEMRTWDREKFLRWIQQRSHDILEDDDLDNFNKAHINGAGFLRSDFKDGRRCKDINVNEVLGTRLAFRLDLSGRQPGE